MRQLVLALRLLLCRWLRFPRRKPKEARNVESIELLVVSRCREGAGASVLGHEQVQGRPTQALLACLAHPAYADGPNEAKVQEHQRLEAANAARMHGTYEALGSYDALLTWHGYA